MHLKEHIMASVAAGAAVYAVTGSAGIASASAATGIFLDVDHLLDYWSGHSFNLDIKKFFTVCQECDLQRTTLLLHSAELLFALSAAAYLTRSWLVTGIALGACQHIAMDQLVNKVYPQSYFLIYRWLKGFRSEAVFTNAPRRADNGKY